MFAIDKQTKFQHKTHRWCETIFSDLLQIARISIFLHVYYITFLLILIQFDWNHFKCYDNFIIFKFIVSNKMELGLSHLIDQLWIKSNKILLTTKLIMDFIPFHYRNEHIFISISVWFYANFVFHFVQFQSLLYRSIEIQTAH